MKKRKNMKNWNKHVKLQVYVAVNIYDSGNWLHSLYLNIPWLVLKTWAKNGKYHYGNHECT